MRYSANLNIIIKALEKASNHVARDFVELENLQANPQATNKFAGLTYNRVKQILIDEFTKFRIDYDIFFSDSQKIIRKENNEYRLNIIAIDGIENFVRANPDFTIAIALQHNIGNNKYETIAMAIMKIIGGELFYCEKGFGAFLNNRRLRVSKRNLSQQIVFSDCLNINNSNIKNYNFGCNTMGIGYFACARLEQIILDKNDSQFLQSFFLIAKEAGGKIEEKDGKIIISNI